MPVSLLVFAVALALCVVVVADSACKICNCFERKGKLYVDCRYLDLDYVPANLPTKTSRLFLNGNNIKALNGSSFGNSPMNDLRVLQLNNNPIATIDTDSFQYTYHIHTLLLQYTDITTIQTGLLNNMTRLKWVWLNNCKISNVDSDSFRNLTRLWELYIYENPLASLPDGIFRDNRALHHLYAQDTATPTATCCSVYGLATTVDVKWPGKVYGDTLSCGKLKRSCFCYPLF